MLIHCKYIVLDSPEPQVILFPLSMKDTEIIPIKRIISAGRVFINLETTQIEVYGHSTSLNLASRSEDNLLIKLAYFKDN